MKYRYKRTVPYRIIYLLQEFIISAIDFIYYHFMVEVIAESNNVTLEKQIEELDKLAPFFFVRIITYLYFGWCLVHFYMEVFKEYGRKD